MREGLEEPIEGGAAKWRTAMIIRVINGEISAAKVARLSGLTETEDVVQAFWAMVLPLFFGFFIQFWLVGEGVLPVRIYFFQSN